MTSARRLQFLAAAATAATLASCAASGASKAVVVLDEAFAAAYPELAASLQAPSAFAGPLDSLFGRAAKPLVISLSQSPGLALDAARAAEGGKPGSTALVASPLIASALAGGGTWKGEPRLLVPEWRGESVPGLSSAYSDPIPAYRQVGAALGAYIARLAQDGGSPSCGILFSESRSRPREALEAFARGYAEASGGRALQVRELQSRSTGPESGPSGNPADSAAIGPEDAAAEMLGSDIRALFIALGPDTAAAIRAAARPGLALGADYPDTAARDSLAFRLAPDWKGLVEALAGSLREGTGSGTGGSEAIAVPVLVEVLGPAAGFKAGGRGLPAYLREARAKTAR